MLVLTRRTGEVLTLGDNIRVKVLRIKNNEVSIGIHAPKQVPIHREEIYKRVKRERKAEFLYMP